MSVDFMAPEFTSEELLGGNTNTITSVEELAPDFTENEPVTDRIRKALEKVDCPECGQKITAARLTRHVGSQPCLKAQGALPEKPPSTTEPKTTTPKATKVTPTPRRVKADDVLTLAASGAGQLLSMSNLSPAAGMALQLEAGLIGPAIDKAVAGTIVDKAVIQPIVRTKGKFDAVAPLVMFPMLVGYLEKQPAMLPQVYPFLRMAIVPMLDSLVVSMRKQAIEAEKIRAAAAELTELSPEFAAMFAGGGEPVDAVLEFVLGRKIERVQFVQEPTVEEPGSAWDGQQQE